MSDNYQSWIERVMGGREGRPLATGDTVSTPGAQDFGTIEFAKLTRSRYRAEVGKRGDCYIYHFYPSQNEGFEDKMGDAFLQVFKNPDQIEAGWTEQLESWAVRVNGFATSIWGDELAVKVFDVLDDLLEK